MDTNTINAIKTALAPIAQKIGQGASFGWDVVIRQQIIYGFIGIFFALIGFIAIPFLVRGVKLCWDNYKRDGRFSDWDVTATMLTIFGSAAIIIFIIVGSIAGLSHLINPAYYALNFFIHLGSSN